VLCALAVALVAAAPAAAADGWLPHPADATWTYQWTDTAYGTAPTTEHVSVVRNTGSSYVLGWTVDGGVNQNGCVDSAGNPLGQNVSGWVELQETNLGIVNGGNGWCGGPPPPEFPVLCSSAARCGNSLSSTLYQLIWGTRAPLLAEPLVRNLEWSSTGGAQNDVTSVNDYAGTELVSVPAFPQPVLAAKVRSNITQAGALGDPYGSGVRTVWWVYGVGPVKIEFQHAGGTGAPITTSVLQTTNQAPKALPSDEDYFPLRTGLKGKYRWTNKRYFKKPEVESFTFDQASNGTAIAKFQSVSGPMKVAGAYQFTSRLDGVVSVASATKAASLAKLPPLGPQSLPANKRRHFFTPFDLMSFGFNPLIPAYPAAGMTWSSDPNGRDFAVYGVSGTSRVVGVQRVTVPAGTYQALVVTSKLTQRGFRFGSGTRTMWFAPGKGLVKLQFRHGDGSTSVVELLH
jgi:hypothetical protein